MKKVIRPLTAFKKANKELYNIYNTIFNEGVGTSVKAKENNFYSTFSVLRLKDEKTSFDVKYFFWDTSLNKRINITIATELGRLLLYGWYYNLYDYSEKLCFDVIKVYFKKVKLKEKILDVDFCNVLQDLRINLEYYNIKKDEAKLLILDRLLSSNLKNFYSLETKENKEALEFFLTIKKAHKKRGLDYWINRAEDYEGYCYYLQDLLELNNLSFENLNEYFLTRDKEVIETLTAIELEKKQIE